MDDRGEARLPLEGFRVLELGYGIAAPVAARDLAQLGADVIRIESARRARLVALRWCGLAPGPVRPVRSTRHDSGAELLVSREAQHRARDRRCRGRAVFEQLVAASDVVVTNISEDALAELGIAYEDIRALKPDIVYLTLPAFGSEGPYRSYRTWGHNLSAASGIDHLLGWPDREPVQIGFAYPDFVSAQAATVAVLAALMRRDTTGEGARIEVWQYAIALACLGPTMVAAELSGEHRRAGQPCRGTGAAHAVSRSGDDRWVAVSVQDGRDVGRAVSGSGAGVARHRPTVRDAGAPARASGRPRRRARRVDRCAHRLGGATELQAAGVAASPVLDAWDVDRRPSARRARFLPHAPARAVCSRPRVRPGGSALGDTAAIRACCARVRRAHARRVA